MKLSNVDVKQLLSIMAFICQQEKSRGDGSYELPLQPDERERAMNVDTAAIHYDFAHSVDCATKIRSISHHRRIMQVRMNFVAAKRYREPIHGDARASEQSEKLNFIKFIHASWKLLWMWACGTRAAICASAPPTIM